MTIFSLELVDDDVAVTLLQSIGSELGQVMGSWEELLPSILGCYGSVAGCDYCFYFLSTYNLSVVPSACSSGCSFAVFGSCVSLITESFTNTFV